MEVTESPIKNIRQRLGLTQTKFAAAAGVSKGHMSEVEAGIAQLGEKFKKFLGELFIKVEEVEKEHQLYMEHKRQEYRAEAAQDAQIKGII